MAVIRTCLKLLAVGLLISAVAVRADDDDEDEEGDADAGASVGTVIGIDLGESTNREPARKCSHAGESVCVRIGACETWSRVPKEERLRVWI